MLNLLLLSLQAGNNDALMVDPLLIVQAQEVWNVIGRPSNPVWAGWDARMTPILIYFPGKQDVLINHPRPPAGFHLYRGPVKSTIGPIWIKDGPTIFSMDGQNTSTVVGGVPTLVVADSLSTRRQWAESLAPAIVADPAKADDLVGSSIYPDPYHAMATFTHEAFHVYQDKVAPRKAGSEEAVVRYPSLSIENNVGYALESDLLADAVRAADGGGVRAAALKWLAVRRWRQSYLPKEAVNYDDSVEYLEGTAKFTEYRLMQYLQGRTPSRDMWWIQGFHGYDDLFDERDGMVKQMQMFVSGQASVNNDPYGASPVRFRLYYTGMAVCAMLDRLGKPWQDKLLKTDTSLTDLVQAAVQPAATDLDKAFAEVKSGPKFADLMQAKAKLARDGETAIEAEVAKFDQAPARVVIDYSGLAKPKVGLTYTAFGVLRVDDSRRIYRLVPISGNAGGMEFSEDSPRPVMQDDQARTLTYTLSSPLDKADLAKQVGGPLGPDTLASNELRLPGMTLHKVKARLRVDGNTLTVRVLD